ncbi:hypothetical protein CLM82_13635, partial [Streptomyces albidoflavus]
MEQGQRWWGPVGRGTEARPEPAEVPPQAAAPGGEGEGASAAEIHPEVRAGAALQAVTRRYRRLVAPACGPLLTRSPAYRVDATEPPPCGTYPHVWPPTRTPHSPHP